MRRLIVALVLLVVVTATACTPSEMRSWLAWHREDPQAAVDWVYSSDGPQFAEWLAAHPAEGGADGVGVPGDCSSYHDDMAAAGLPVTTFSAIGWRETGCRPAAWVVDSDDVGGAMFGFNFIGGMAGYWYRLCGATTATIRNNVPLIMRCAAAEYRSRGLAAWR